MRILHLSDIHIPANGPSHGQKKVFAALLRDIKRISAVKPVDLVAITGDVAHQGNIGSGFTPMVKGNFFDALTEVMPSVRVMLCPGNHDVNLRARDEIFSPIFDKIATPGDADRLFDKISSGAANLFEHMDGYLAMAREIAPGAYANNPFFYTEKFQTDSISIGVVSLNSAWNTRGGGNADYGRLFLSERQIDSALAEVDKCEIKIALMHHGLKWLHPNEGGIVQRLLAANFHAVLCGHNHENSATNIMANIGSVFVSNTGCIYESREYFNGYSVLDFDFASLKWGVMAREYYYQRDEFGTSERFSEGGVAEFNLSAELGSDCVVIPSSVISEVQDRAASKLLSYTASDVAPKQLGAMFVEPPIAELDEKRFVNQNSDNPAYLTLSELARMPESLLVVGKRESGKTLLLHEIAANRFLDFSPRARVGVVIDFSVLPRFTEAAILEQLVEATGGDLRRKDIVELLRDGRALVCIDNCHLENEKHRRLVTDFLSKFPKVRFVLGAPEELHSPVSVSEPTPDIGVPLKRVFIHSFRRRQVREMVRKWFGDDRDATNAKLGLVNQLLAQLNVPATPFLVSVLLWVIEQRPNSSLINQSAAIEVLIEGLLEKLKESKSRTEFDSTIQTHFLSDLAAHLDAIGQEWMSAIDFDAFVVDYFKRKGLQVSTHGFADELLRKGLLYSTAERVTFKFDCFRAYFLAKRFADQPHLWQRAFSSEQIHRYPTEIDLFTGLHRDRRDVLEVCINLCEELFERTSLNVPLGILDEFGAIPQVTSVSRLMQLESELEKEAVNEGSREQRLDEYHRPSNASVDHESSRQRSEFQRTSEELLFFAALKSLSVVVRNSELVDDVLLKEKALSAVVEYWSKFMLCGLHAIKHCEKQELLNTGVFPDGMNLEKMRNSLLLLFPQAFLSIVSESLATPKLNSFFTKLLSSEYALIPTITSLIALDSKDKNAAQIIKSVLHRFKDKKFVVQIIFFRLLTVHQWDDLSVAELRGVRDCLSECYALLTTGSSAQKAHARNVFLNSLEKQTKINLFNEEK